MPKSTGPTTPHGKKTSSQNSTTHGCRSKRLLVGDERQEDFDALDAGWRVEYGGDGQALVSLMSRVIGGTDPLDWTAEQHVKVALFLRYKTTWERSFYRAYNCKICTENAPLLEDEGAGNGTVGAL